MVGRIYQSLVLTSDVQVNFDEQRWEHYNLFNARYVVAPEGQRFPDFVKPLQQFGPITCIKWRQLATSIWSAQT